MPEVTSTEHALLYGVAAAGEGGVTRPALLSQRAIIEKASSGNAAVKHLAKSIGVRKAEQQMRDPEGSRKAFAEYLAATLDSLIEQRRIVEEDGVLTLGRMPRGYQPLRQEIENARSLSTLNVVAARRKTKGWTYFVNPEIDEGAVARLAESMQREGWPKGHTILLDADGNVADGKHHIAAAELVGLDWEAHTVTITDEIALWQQVKARNFDRWSMAKGEMAKRHAAFLALRPDISIGEKVEALRQSMAGVSERTQQRATSETKHAAKAERDEQVRDGLGAGKSVRQVAKETGVPKSTVDRVAKSEPLSQNRHDGGNGTPQPAPEVVGLCCVCQTSITKGEKVAERIVVKEGFGLFRPQRKGGGTNQIFGPVVATGEVAHQDCCSEQAQAGYRSRQVAS